MTRSVSRNSSPLIQTAPTVRASPRRSSSPSPLSSNLPVVSIPTISIKNVPPLFRKGKVQLALLATIAFIIIFIFQASQERDVDTMKLESDDQIAPLASRYKNTQPQPEQMKVLMDPHEYDDLPEVPIVSGLAPPNREADSLRILVTGGAGFIGSHLVDRLMEMGHQVIVADNLFSGKKANIMKWIDHERFEFIRHDITEHISLEVDQIYHLACPASPLHYKYNPIKTMKTNFYGTYNMLGLAARTNARFLLASSSEVYGDPLMHPQKENYWGNVNPIGMRSCYDEGKRVAETLSMDYSRQAGVDVRIARIFNTYGPRMSLNDGRVLSNFVTRAIQGDNIHIEGDGSQVRTFCYVADIVDGLIRLMNKPEMREPVNLGSTEEYTIQELANLVKNHSVKKIDIEHVPQSLDDPHKRKPDIRSAEENLGWTPQITLREGIKYMIRDFSRRVNS